MEAWELRRIRLSAGRWEGRLSGPVGAPPALVVSGPGGEIGPPRLVPDGDGRWTVTIDLPPVVLSDGVQSIVFAIPGGTPLLVEAMAFGDALDGDLRAEVASLRAELEVLKRAFRRHVTEGD